MQNTRWSVGLLTVAAASTAALGGAPSAGADVATSEQADPAVVAGRQAKAMGTLPPGYTTPPDVEDTVTPVAGARFAGTYVLDGKSTEGGYVRVLGRDNIAQDDPGWASTTMRIYGNVGAFRKGSGPIALKSQFTCSGIGIGSVSIGTSGASVSGGSTSTTLTINSSRSASDVVRQYYTSDGHFRCKASNASPAETTRRATASTRYKDTDTRAQDDYSFWW